VKRIGLLKCITSSTTTVVRVTLLRVRQCFLPAEILTTNSDEIPNGCCRLPRKTSHRRFLASHDTNCWCLCLLMMMMRHHQSLSKCMKKIYVRISHHTLYKTLKLYLRKPPTTFPSVLLLLITVTISIRTAGRSRATCQLHSNRLHHQSSAHLTFCGSVQPKLNKLDEICKIDKYS